MSGDLCAAHDRNDESLGVTYTGRRFRKDSEVLFDMYTKADFVSLGVVISTFEKAWEFVGS